MTNTRTFTSFTISPRFLQVILTALAALALVATTFISPTGATAAPPTAPPPEHIEGQPRSVHTYEPGQIPNVERPTGSNAPMAARSLHPAGNVKVKLVRVELAGNVGNYRTVSVGAAKRAVQVANNYWSDMSDGRISISVDRTVRHHESRARASQSYGQIMQTITNELDWVYKRNTVLVAFIPVDLLSAGAYGAGWSTDGTSGRILMPRPNAAYLTDSVLTHEFGHVFGLGHANALQCRNGASDTADYDGCWIKAYGDTTDLMGTSQIPRPTISASFWDLAGFGSGDEIRNIGVVSGKKSYTLRPWGGERAKRALKFTDPVSGEVYYVELRLPVGQDAYATADGNRGVKITQLPIPGPYELPPSIILEPNTKPFWGYYSKEHAWQEGDTFTTHAGTKVKMTRISGSAAKVTISAPDADAASSGLFADITTRTHFYDEIKWMADSGITTGYSVDNTFRPSQNVSRAETAAFLYRLEGASNYTGPKVPALNDISAKDTHFYDEISWLAAKGITTGYSVDNTFRPARDVSRGEMAAFLYRLAGKPRYSPPAESPFTDISPSHHFYKQITWLASKEISFGYSKDGSFRSRGKITRGETAAFLYRYSRLFGDR